MTWEAAQKRPGKATGSGVASTSQHQPLAPVQREPGSELGAPRDSIRESSHWERRRSWKNEAHHDSPSAVFSMTESSAGISKRPSSWWRGAIDQKLREGAQRPRGPPHPQGYKLPLQRPRILVLGTPIRLLNPQSETKGTQGSSWGAQWMGLRTGPISAPLGPHAPLQARPGSAGSRPSRHSPASRPPTMLGTVSKAPMLCQMRRRPSCWGRYGRRWCPREVPPRAPSRFLAHWAVQLTPPPPRRPGTSGTGVGGPQGAGVCPLPSRALTSPSAVAVTACLPGPGRGQEEGKKWSLGNKVQAGRGRRWGRRVGIDL